jgi:hypothetical protein
MTRQMQFAEPSGSAILQAYDRDASAHAHAHAHAHVHSHGVPKAMMPTPRCNPKALSAEYRHYSRHQHQHQQHSQMEL